MKITTRPLHHKNENYNKALKKMKITTRIKKEKKIRTRIKKWKLQRDCSTTKMKITTRPLVHSKYQVLLLPSFLNSQSSRIWSLCLLLIKINQWNEPINEWTKMNSSQSCLSVRFLRHEIEKGLRGVYSTLHHPGSGFFICFW